MSILALSFTLISGFFFLLGFWLVKVLKQRKNFNVFGSGLALSIMLGMVFFDIVPEIIENSHLVMMSKWAKIFLILLFLVLGMSILKFFDRFLPAHHHEHHEKEKNVKEHQSHTYHIGMILAFSLILHNFIEGMSLYILAKESISSGIFLTLGIGLHNLPLGMEIKSHIDEKKQEKSHLFILLLLIFSSFIGGFFLFIIGGVPVFVTFTLLSIALGMVLYLALFELLPEVMDYRKNKYTYFGIGLGILLLIIMSFLG